MGRLGFVLSSVIAVATAAIFRRDASPISIPAAQGFLGNDGPWSTFTIGIGTPPQSVNLLAATASSQTLVILQSGCPRNITNAFPQCATARGLLYDQAQSSTWHEQGISAIVAQQDLGTFRDADFGNETINLNAGGSAGVLQNQVIGGVNALEYWVGELGLGLQSADSDHAGALMALHQQGTIPSLSYGYTAGNPYRLKGVLGSLTLGGYDAARLKPNGLSVSFTSNGTRDLVVGVQTITTDMNGTSTSLLPSGILAPIDASASEIWLPLEACRAFERAFGLEWNETAQIYAVNSSRHTALQEANANVTFTLGQESSGGSTVDVVLPYAAFDLTAQWPRWPVFPQNTAYFPLRRAANASQYTLGRTFLQEAYLSVNWEKGEFNVSLAAFPEDNRQQLVAIPSSSTPSESSNSGGSSSSSNGQTIGLAVGLTLGLLLLLGLATFFFLRYRRRRRRSEAEPTDDPSKPSSHSPSPSSSSPMTARTAEKQELGAGPDHARYEAADPTAVPKSPGEMIGSTSFAAEMQDPATVTDRHELPSDVVGAGSSSEGPQQGFGVVADVSSTGQPSGSQEIAEVPTSTAAESHTATGQSGDVADVGGSLTHVADDHKGSTLAEPAGADPSGESKPQSTEGKNTVVPGSAAEGLDGRVSPVVRDHGMENIASASPTSPLSMAGDAGVSPQSVAADAGEPRGQSGRLGENLAGSRPDFNRQISTVSSLPSLPTPEPERDHDRKAELGP